MGTRRTYSRDFKVEALRPVLERRVTVSQATRDVREVARLKMERVSMKKAALDSIGKLNPTEEYIAARLKSESLSRPTNKPHCDLVQAGLRQRRQARAITARAA